MRVLPMRLAAFALVAWGLVLLARLLAGAAPAAAQASYGWRMHAPTTGVPVYAAALDARGQVVVGTSRGLYRFDGLTFDPIPLGPGPVGEVFRIEAAPDGALWALMTTDGFVRLAPDGQVRRIPFPPGLAREGYRLSVPGRRMRPDARGLWVAIGHTFWHYDLAAGRWANRSFAPGLRFRSFALGARGPRGDTLWMADTARVGFSVVGPGQRPGAPVWLDEVPGYLGLEAHPGGGVWAVRHDGVFRGHADGSRAMRWRRVSSEGLGSSWFALAPSVAPDGQFFTALHDAHAKDRFALALFSPEGAVRLEERRTAFAPFGSALIDREGSLWVSSAEGLAQLDQPQLGRYDFRSPEGPEDDAYLALEAPGGRGLWASTYQGPYFVPTRGAPVRLVRGRTRSSRFTLAEGGTAYLALREHNTSDDRYFAVRLPDLRLRPLDHLPVRRLKDGRTLESRAGGTFLVGPGRAVRLSGTPVNVEYGMPQEGPWPGTNGVTWLLHERFDALVGDSLVSACRRCAPPSVLRTADSVAALQVNDVATDRYGRLWVAHRGGFDVFAPAPDGTVQRRHFAVGDGAVGPTHGVSVSPDGERLWIGTSHGLVGYRVPPPAPALPSLGTPIFRLSRRFAHNGEQTGAVFEDRAGILWAPVSPGRLHRIDWRALRPEPSPPVQAIEVQRNNVPVPDGALVRLEAGRDGMRLRLWPTTYRDAMRVRLEYRLVGLDTAWTDLGIERTLRFGSLPRGRFRLEVRAVRDGQAPGPAFVLPIVAAPPFYRATWFLVLVAVLSAALAGGGVYLVQARRLALARLRWRLARDLHDDLGSGLAQISVLSELLRRRADPEAAAWAARVGEEARGLTARMRDLVWALRPGDARADALADRLRAEASALLSPADLSFEVVGTAEHRPPDLSPEVRRALLLAVREMLANVVRHARASHVVLRYHLDAHRVALVVEDDGAGFADPLPPAGSHGGFGLVGLHQRAKALGGRFDVASTPGMGTVATFEVPLRAPRFWRPHRPPRAAAPRHETPDRDRPRDDGASGDSLPSDSLPSDGARGDGARGVLSGDGHRDGVAPEDKTTRTGEAPARPGG